ncbi:hypothetical protein [Desulforegula conservatrix]|uniref:hypothetical protein n=1 Tax=Desulforegula conservatrix TaxID=153026 RepID=UPI0009FC7110|nr:hypothetical protein [Desulforegula conservatrix]
MKQKPFMIDCQAFHCETLDYGDIQIPTGSIISDGDKVTKNPLAVITEGLHVKNKNIAWKALFFLRWAVSKKKKKGSILR